MSRVGVFRSHNKVGETCTFQTIIYSGATGKGSLSMNVGFKDDIDSNIKRVQWDIGKVTNSYGLYENPTGGYQSNAYWYTQFTPHRFYNRPTIRYGSVNYSGVDKEYDPKTITIRTNKLSDLGYFTDDMNNQNNAMIYGHLDFTGWDNLKHLTLWAGHHISGMTFSEGKTNFENFEFRSNYNKPKITTVDGIDHPSGGLIGTLDVSPLRIGGSFMITGCEHLSGVTFGAPNGVVNNFQITNCGNLRGNLDLTSFNHLGGVFLVRTERGSVKIPLTAITHTASTEVITRYDIRQTSLKELNLSGITIGMDSWSPGYDHRYVGIFNARWCSLTGITHHVSPQVDNNINHYSLYDNDIIGQLDVSNLMLGSVHSGVTSHPTDNQVRWGSFDTYNNNSLTGITHSPNNHPLFGYLDIKYYHIVNCDITGNHDMTWCPKLYGQFWMGNNSNLTSITHTATTTTEPFTHYNVRYCNLTGNHDMTWANKLGGHFSVQGNPNLTGVTHTASTEMFSTYHDYQHGAYSIANCNITGNHDVSMLSNLGGDINLNNNSSLTGVTFTGNDNSIVIRAYSCDLKPTFDISMFSGLTNLEVYNNYSLTGITFNNNHLPTTTVSAANCDLKPELDFETINMTGLTSLNVHTNPNLVNIKFAESDTPLTIKAYDCNLTGGTSGLDLTNCSGLIYLDIHGNSNLTGVTFTSSVEEIKYLVMRHCNLTGELDISMLTTLGTDDPAGPTFSSGGGYFDVSNNPNLTGFIHPPSTNMIYNFNVSNCDMKPHLDLSNYSIGVANAWTNQYAPGYINMSGNANLTSVTHAASPTYIRRYDCNYTGLRHLDVSMLDVGCAEATDFNGTKWESSMESGSYTESFGFHIQYNSSLTGVTHGSYTRRINNYSLNNNDLTGTHDISGLVNLRFKIRLHNNPNLTDILFPTSTEDFFDTSTQTYNHALQLNDCSLGYVDFSPLAGARLNNGATTSTKYATIHLEDNGMSATDVNHILVDFATIAANNSPRWDNVTLIIDGSNAAPDGTSGGYNGSAAVTTLTGSPYNWIITTS